MDKRTKPFIGITIGDFNGIGPEIILKTVSDPRILTFCTPVIFGSGRLFNKLRKATQGEQKPAGTENQAAATEKDSKLPQPEQLHFSQTRPDEPLSGRKVNMVNCWEEDYNPTPGKPTPESGKCALLSIQMASKYLEAGKIDAVVTAPIDKDNIQSDEFKFPGHTEFFTSYFKAEESLMLLVSGQLRVATLTGHVPLKDVAQRITAKLLRTKLLLLAGSLQKDFGILKPRMAVLGLNPHAGENGLLGTEEKEIILPVIKELREKGMLVYGPYPADGFFATGAWKKFDGTMATYHDQGLVPFKTLAFDSGVNFTAGLSVVRTSPDHGTAYDIAGKGLAIETSFREALYAACDIYKQRAFTPEYALSK